MANLDFKHLFNIA